ncbi:MAG: DNA replication/repair protein RecF [Clostridia bacterium]|nr:DNA replication/repair protein RecF [Clostridia bacterium]
MLIKNLTLKNFRNYAEETFRFGEELTVLTGANAQGKTNAAEAVFFLCTGYSPRAGKDKLVIRNGCETAEIEGVAESSYGGVSVKIIFDKNDGKKVYINGCETARIGELMGNINSVFFNPAELKLVQDSPEDRRRFMNISLSQMSKNYFYSLQKYNRILLQRNNLLKDRDFSLVKDTLFVWDGQLCKAAATVIRQRNAFLSEIAPIAKEKHLYLSDGKETLEMRSESGYSGTEEEIEKNFARDLKDGFERDLRLGYTAIGPHRDDIKFILNGDDARIFGSQGQQRTVALSLKLAEAEIFKNRSGEYPVLILDDVLSELDKNRQKRLIDATHGIQTIFTATGISPAAFRGRKYAHIAIENGKIKKTVVRGV